MGSATRTRCFASISALWFLASPVSAQELTGELRLGGGYDSNPDLAADPSNRRIPDDTTTATVGQSLFAIDGALKGVLREGDLAARARFTLMGRIYGSGDLLFWESLEIAGEWSIDPLTLGCGLEGARLDLTLSADDAWRAGARCRARVGLPLGFDLALEGAGGVRSFDAGQLDAIGGGRFAVGWTFRTELRAELGFAVTRRQADQDRATRTELSPDIAIVWRWEMLGGRLGYRMVSREFDSMSRSGVEHVGRLSVYVMPLEWLGAYASLRLGYAEGRSQALAYERVEIVGGVRFTFEHRPPPGEESTQGPVRVEGGRAHFRFELPEAGAVSVIGDWNGWDADAGALSRGDGGVFEGSFQIAPGRHVYHLIVDGVPRVPPGTIHRVGDGFGGENAVFLVP